MRSTQENASLEWREGLPISTLFADSYFSDDSGLDECRHVFIEGNELFKNPQVEKHQKIVVLETGFGTGLNFLALWVAWEKAGKPFPIQFVSVEKYPLSEFDIQKAHAFWPRLACPSQALRQQWPSAKSGWQNLSFEQNQIQLQIFHGDIHTWCQELLQLKLSPTHWFLDGFSPAKNPEMWCDELFHTMAQTAQAGTRFATYTCAGFVRRALQAKGFIVEKSKGFGRKRDMLKGQWPLESSSL